MSSTGCEGNRIAPTSRTAKQIYFAVAKKLHMTHSYASHQDSKGSTRTGNSSQNHLLIAWRAWRSTCALKLLGL